MDPYQLQRLNINDRQDSRIQGQQLPSFQDGFSKFTLQRPAATDRNQLPPRPPPLLPYIYDGYQSTSSSPSPRTAYSESLSSSSRRSSVSSKTPSTTYSQKNRSTQRGSASHESGSEVEALRGNGLKRPSSVLDCVSNDSSNRSHKKNAQRSQTQKSVAKTKNEKRNRKDSAFTMQNNEDLLSIALDYEVGVVQTTSNSKRSGLKCGKQPNLDSTHAGFSWLLQRTIKHLLAAGGHDTVEHFKAEFRDYLRQAEAEAPQRNLPSDSWMAADTHNGDEVCCELAYESTMCEVHSDRKEERKNLRRFQWQRMYRQLEAELSPAYAHRRGPSRADGSSRTTSSTSSRR